MRNHLHHTPELYEEQICGLHQYRLDDPLHLCYVSRNLCALLGMNRDELLDDKCDLYAPQVHPADRAAYQASLRALCAGKQAHLTYRLLKKDGTVLHVHDTITAAQQADGARIATSVLADVTALVRRTDELQFLNDTIPCGLLKYTCEKQPRVTYINRTMLDILRFPQGAEEAGGLALSQTSIFLMIPVDEQRRFTLYLNRVFSSDLPIAGEMTLLRCDGTRAYLFGWVSKAVNAQGEAEFQSVCMDITQRRRRTQAAQAARYLKALTDVYDKIFEFNRNTGTVKCLHCGDDSMFKQFENVAMQQADAIGKWINTHVVAQERAGVLSFFRDFFRGKAANPPQLIYHALASDGRTLRYVGLFLAVSEETEFFCCRPCSDEAASAELRSENERLREDMKALVLRFSDSIAAFEVTPDEQVKPLYASENICEFFGYTQAQWLALTERFTPLTDFVHHSEVPYADFEALLQNGEAEFLYFDYKTEREKKVKAVCSRRQASQRGSSFVMLYTLDDPRAHEPPAGKRTVLLRTFGYFDVFVGEQPIAFRNQKSKELLALLVDRRGGYVTSEEAIGYLWMDEPANTVTRARYRKVALRLKNTLEQYGIAEILETVEGKRRIIMERVQCDLYDYLAGKDDQSFKGSYLTNYSWAETTLGELVSNQKQREL